MVGENGNMGRSQNFCHGLYICTYTHVGVVCVHNINKNEKLSLVEQKLQENLSNNWII